MAVALVYFLSELNQGQKESWQDAVANVRGQGSLVNTSQSFGTQYGVGFVEGQQVCSCTKP